MHIFLIKNMPENIFFNLSFNNCHDLAILRSRDTHWQNFPVYTAAFWSQLIGGS